MCIMPIYAHLATFVQTSKLLIKTIILAIPTQYFPDYSE